MKGKSAVAFFLGLFFGWMGVRIVTHIVYLATIITLVIMYLTK